MNPAVNRKAPTKSILLFTKLSVLETGFFVKKHTPTSGITQRPATSQKMVRQLSTMCGKG